MKFLRALFRPKKSIKTLAAEHGLNKKTDKKTLEQCVGGRKIVKNMSLVPIINGYEYKETND